MDIVIQTTTEVGWVFKGKKNLGCLEKKISDIKKYGCQGTRWVCYGVPGTSGVSSFLMVISQFFGTDGWAGPKAGCSGTIRVRQWKNRP